MQDIAGCRLVVENLLAQDNAVRDPHKTLERTTESDRRQKSSHGYRAVHVVVEICGKPIKVQVRTSLQHLWAEQSEKLSDLVNPAIKYGGGDELYRSFLLRSSKLVAHNEAAVRALAKLDMQDEEKVRLTNELAEIETEIQA